MALIKLDAKDKKILEALDLNARYFISDVAKKVKLNKEVVKYRIHNLEKKNVIKSYNTLINYAKLGLSSIKVGLNLMDTTNEDVGKIVEHISKSQNLQSLRQCDVQWDVVFTLIVKDLREFENFFDGFKEKFRKFIEFHEISITTSNTVFSKSFVPDSTKNRLVIDACAEKQDFDDTDINILKIIAYDAKCPLIDIAKKLKLDSMTVKRRIEAMVKKGIIAGFVTQVDPKSIGINNYSIILQLFDTSRVNAFREHIASLPQTVEMRGSIGKTDFEFKVEVKEYFELEEMINELRTNFPIIREITMFTTLRHTAPKLHENLDKIIKK